MSPREFSIAKQGTSLDAAAVDLNGRPISARAPDPFIGDPIQRTHPADPQDLHDLGSLRPTNRERWDLGIDWSAGDDWGFGLGASTTNGGDFSPISDSDPRGPFDRTGLVSEGSNPGGLALRLFQLAIELSEKLGSGWVDVSYGSGSVTATIINSDGKKPVSVSSAGSSNGLAVGLNADGTLYLDLHGVDDSGAPWSYKVPSGVKPNFDTYMWLRVNGGRVPLKTPNPMDERPTGSMPGWARRELRELHPRSPRSDSGTWGAEGGPSAGRVAWADLDLLVGGGFTDPSPIDERVSHRSRHTEFGPRPPRRTSDDPGDFGGTP